MHSSILHVGFCLSLCVGLCLVTYLFLTEGEEVFSGCPRMEHLQTKFCNANIVTEVTMREFVGLSKEGILKYRVDVMTIFKGSEKFEQTSEIKSLNLTTELKGSERFSMDVEYIVSGSLSDKDTLHVTECDFVIPWAKIHNDQLFGFNGLYQENCDCTISYKPNIDFQETGGEECLAGTDPILMFCLDKYGFCERSNNISGKCSWGSLAESEWHSKCIQWYKSNPKLFGNRKPVTYLP